MISWIFENYWGYGIMLILASVLILIEWRMSYFRK